MTVPGTRIHHASLAATWAKPFIMYFDYVLYSELSPSLLPANHAKFC
jgi:hypothetical protein